MISNWMIGKSKKANEERILKEKSIDYDEWRRGLEKQFNHLKEAPIDEYFSRILDIAIQMKNNLIKF